METTSRGTLTDPKMLPSWAKRMIQEFQCAGCVCGSDVNCGQLEFIDPARGIDSQSCAGHCPGTSMGSPGRGLLRFILGMPKGFNRVGQSDRKNREADQYVRLWPEGKKPTWDNLNIPVWAMEQDGYLFVRTFSPRINESYIDVIDKGKISDVPSFTIPFSVAMFKDEID